MDALAGWFAAALDRLEAIVWGVPLLLLLVGVGLFLSVRTGFFQFRRLRFWWSKTAGTLFLRPGATARKRDGRAISQLQSVSTALAATLGTGNLLGVAAALAVGGPGAIFWMWVSALLGMATAYAETVLSLYYRRRNAAGEWSGGAMYYLEDGLRDRPGLRRLARPLAVAFAVCCALASFGIGNLAQANALSDALRQGWGVRPAVAGFAAAVLVAVVLSGGIRRIGRVTGALVPLLALLYLGGSLVLLFGNRARLPGVFADIFRAAFRWEAVAGGTAGSLLRRTVKVGLQRGVFSNEAGLGSAALAHASADVDEPVEQGAWAVFSVFFDTLLSCTLTALVLLSCTVRPVDLPTALARVTVAPQYVALRPDDAGKPVALLAAQPRAVQICLPADGAQVFVTAYGRRLCLPLRGLSAADARDGYSNVLELRGVWQTDAAGRRLTDAAGNPVLSAVQIARPAGVSLVACAFRQRFGDAAVRILSATLLLLAFSTILGWSFYGGKALESLFGPRALPAYRVGFVGAVFVGATLRPGLVWRVCDLLNGLMALPNLLGLLALSGLVARITENYFDRTLRGRPVAPMRSRFAWYNRTPSDKSEE